MDDALRNERLEVIRASWLRLQRQKIAERRALAEVIKEAEAPKLEAEPAPKAPKRQYKGPDKRAKINPEIVLEIRRRIRAGDQQRALAKAFGVSTATICGIGSRRIWAWVEEGASE